MAATRGAGAVITPAEVAQALGERAEDWLRKRRTSRAAFEASLEVNTERLEQVAKRVAVLGKFARIPADSPLTGTLLHLTTLHNGPVIPLKDVCDTYFGLSFQNAMKAAALNRLPVPTFRLTPSRKAPLLVLTAKLAEFIDRTADSAAREWQKSQL
jgi:hypothetical protein